MFDDLRRPGPLLFILYLSGIVWTSEHSLKSPISWQMSVFCYIFAYNVSWKSTFDECDGSI